MRKACKAQDPRALRGNFDDNGYTCPNSTSWRVKKQGDKKDKSFSWKNTDPKDVWQRVIQNVEELKETS